MAALFEDAKLFKNGGGEAPADVLRGKIVGLYFSADWCGPCRAFTPLLKDFYEKLSDSGEFEIVFVTLDESEEELQKYLAEAHGSWYYLALRDELIKELEEKFEVDGIPDLIILKENGDVITVDGTNEVDGEKPPADVLAAWKSV